MGIYLNSITGLLLVNTCVAQTLSIKESDNKNDPYDSRSYFMYGANYLSNNVYLGRKDTVVTPYISAYAGYRLRQGLQGKAIVSYSPIKKKIDLVTLQAAYEHTFGKHMNTGASADKYFYNKNTNTVRGNTKASAGIYGQYENDWLQPTLSFDVNFNKKTDYVLGLTLDHNFSLRNNTLNITPAIALNAGTQHYYDEYFTNKLNRKDKSLKLAKALANSARFKMLDYELSAQATCRVSKWLFTVTPTYAIPLNPNTITTNTQTYTEKISNSFYIEVDICHR